MQPLHSSALTVFNRRHQTDTDACCCLYKWSVSVILTYRFTYIWEIGNVYRSFFWRQKWWFLYTSQMVEDNSLVDLLRFLKLYWRILVSLKNKGNYHMEPISKINIISKIIGKKILRKFQITKLLLTSN